ncbi:MAG TPA: hypothetical protein VFI37_13370 [Gaiellaceae bacterium]|nr:hypothetical protein [Gaiellaceae bacterium]
MRNHLKRNVGIAAVAVAAIAVFTAAAPARTQDKPKLGGEPVVTGTAAVGRTLQATTGNWDNNPTKYAYSWERCDNGKPSSCDAIKGATHSTYKLVDDDLGKDIRVVVTASNADGSTSAESNPVGPVGSNKVPQNTAAPSISGDAKVGSTLTADEGKWSNNPTSFDYQWLRCDSGGNNCGAVNTATKKTYAVTSADVGGTLRVRVTAKTAGGTGGATSGATGVVGGTSGGGGGGGCSVAIGSVDLPARLLIDKWSFDPSTLTGSTDRFTARIHIQETSRNCSVGGARVQGTAIPFNQTSNETATTGSDGWATLSFSMKGGYPANPGRQQILALLVRATQPGGSVLAGVSTRRVLSENVNLH